MEFRHSVAVLTLASFAALAGCATMTTSEKRLTGQITGGRPAPPSAR